MKNLQRKSPTLMRLAKDVTTLGAMVSVKRGLPIVNHLIRVVHVLGMGINRSVVKVIITYLARLYHIQRRNGLSFLVKTLKGMNVALMQSIGGQRLQNLNPLGLRFSRTSRGLPRIIPVLHRRRIIAGDLWTLRLWTTLFGLYRVIEVPGKLKVKTITDESTMNQLLLPEFSQFVREQFYPSLSRLVGKRTGIMRGWSLGALEFLASLKARPFLISKSGPHVRKDRDSPATGPVTILSTSPSGIFAAAVVWSSSSLMPFLRDWCKMTKNIWLLNRIDLWSNQKVAGAIDFSTNSGVVSELGSLGRLGFKDEPAGKVRVFAMVDCFSQWLFDPLHKAIFSVLERIPTDGTFDQLAPVRRLMKTCPKGPYYSFDLSAATDRLPLSIQKVLLSSVLGPWAAEVWGTLLVGRNYLALHKDLGETSVLLRYATGQPMGALSSWAMLALTHHAIVQWAALRAGVIILGGKWFLDYAVLGDDIVIANGRVAKQYEFLMDALGVEIGIHKSLISLRGLALEFAKRFLTSVGDASGIPLAEYWASSKSLSVILEFARKHGLTLSQMLSVLGYGYRAKGSMSVAFTKQPSRIANYMIAWYSPMGPGFVSLEDFFTRKGCGSHYKSTPAKVQALCESILNDERKALMDRIDSLDPLVTEIKKLVTVYRDRQHYGMTKDVVPRTVFLDLQDGSWDLDSRRDVGTVLDSIKETVFREAFLDTVIKLRDLRTKLEEFSVVGRDWPAIQELVDLYREVSDELGSLPLPKALYRRLSDKTDFRVKAQWVDLYRAHSGHLRTTKAT